MRGIFAGGKMKVQCSFLAFLLCSTAVNTHSEEKTGPDVFFSVSRTASCRSLPPADALSLDLFEIERGKGGSLADLLEEAAPLNIRKLNGPGGLATVSMRGFQARQTAVFIDDVRVPADITGTVDLSLIPAAGLKKIEVLPGAVSSIYGAGAEGGVVQLFTRRLSPGARLAEAGAGFSAYNTREYFFKAGAAGVHADVFVSGASGSSGGFQQNSALDKDSAEGRASLALGAAGRFTLTGLFSRLRTGLPSGTPVPVSDWNGSREKAANSLTDWQKSERGFVSGSWNGGTEDLALRADSSYSSNEIKAFQWGAPSAATVAERTFSGRATLYQTAVLGAESTVSGLESGTYGDHSISSFGFFAQQRFSPVPGLELTPGARLDRSGVYASRISPKLAAVYAPDERWKFSVSEGAGFQAPTFADLYNPWAAPAQGLKPETSVNSAAAVYYGAPAGWYAGLSGYYSDIKDRIALDPVTWAAANISAALNSGLEAQAGYKAGRVSLSAGYVRNISLVKNAGGGYKTANFSPRNRYTCAFRADLAGFETEFNGRGVSEQFTGAGRTGLHLPEYWVFGLNVSRKFGALEAWCGISNVLDRHYAETADIFNGWFPQPGRTFSAGLNARFL